MSVLQILGPNIQDGARTTDLDGGHPWHHKQSESKLARMKLMLKNLDALHPTNTGRLTLIHRYGADKVGDALPKLIEAVQSTGKQVLFVCESYF